MKAGKSLPVFWQLLHGALLIDRLDSQNESGETLGVYFQRSEHDQVSWHVHREGPDRHITEKRC